MIRGASVVVFVRVARGVRTAVHSFAKPLMLMGGKARNRKGRKSYLSVKAVSWMFAAVCSSSSVVVRTGAAASSAALGRRGQQCSGFLGLLPLQRLTQQKQLQQHHNHHHHQREAQRGSMIRSSGKSLVRPHCSLRFLSPWATRRWSAAAAAQCHHQGWGNKRNVLEPAAVAAAAAADARLLLRSRPGGLSLAMMTTGSGGVFQGGAAAAPAPVRGSTSSTIRRGGVKVLPTTALRGGGDGGGDGSRRMKSAINTPLLRSSSTAAAAATATATATAEADAAVEIIKPDRDQRSYRYLVLPNGLAVVLVSDPHTEQAAASMFIRAGHMQDPTELAGMAHFHEHSETYYERSRIRQLEVGFLYHVPTGL